MNDAAAESPLSLDQLGRPAAGPGHYLRDTVYGAIDGIITTLAVISGATGATLSTFVVLVLGFANLFADGFSMGASNYLGMKSELEQTGQSVAAEKPLRHGAATTLAFVVAGFVPLVAYLLPVGELRFPVAIVLAGITLFVVGGARSRILDKGWMRLGLEMLFVGAIAVVVAYAVGAVAEAFVA